MNGSGTSDGGDRHVAAPGSSRVMATPGRRRDTLTRSRQPMNATATIDYIVVLSGEMHAVLETGETLLKPGDLFVQRGTVHSWSVRGSEPCVIAVVLVSANRI